MKGELLTVLELPNKIGKNLFGTSVHLRVQHFRRYHGSLLGAHDFPTVRGHVPRVHITSIHTNQPTTGTDTLLIYCNSSKTVGNNRSAANRSPAAPPPVQNRISLPPPPHLTISPYTTRLDLNPFPLAATAFCFLISDT